MAAVVDEQIDAAKAHRAGRSAHTIYGGSGHTLRQTVLALAAGQRLDDHESPGEATLLVLRGNVRLATTSGQTIDAVEGQYLEIPQERHNLVAAEDSAVLLTVVAK